MNYGRATSPWLLNVKLLAKASTLPYASQAFVWTLNCCWCCGLIHAADSRSGHFYIHMVKFKQGNGIVKNDVWSMKSINAETHDLRGKPLQCEGEKPRAPASNNLTISRVWVTRLRQLTRESSLHETLALRPKPPATGLRFAPSEARPLSWSEFGTTYGWHSLYLSKGGNCTFMGSHRDELPLASHWRYCYVLGQ